MPWCEMLATSYSKPRLMRVGGQSSPAQSDLPTDRVVSVFGIAELARCMAQMKQISLKNYTTLAEI